jgi:hypothetical protein
MNRTVHIQSLYALMACIVDNFTFFICSIKKCLSLRGRLGRDVRIQNYLLNLKDKCIFARLFFTRLIPSTCIPSSWAGLFLLL